MMTQEKKARPGRVRWTVCALLFAATSVNYIDRQMIGVLKPILQADLGWTEVTYGDVVFWFQAAYAIGFLCMGRFMDKVGARVGYAIAFSFWTLAHIAHGLVGNAGQFSAARFALGLGEAGNFPAGLKAIGEWFPQRERALAVGLFNAGANVGAIITPLLVPYLAVTYGWRAAFVITGAFSVLWVIAWLALYRRPQDHKRVGEAELAWITSDPPSPSKPIAWRRLLLIRETWAYALPKLLTDPIWWMFLFWLPDFLRKRYGLDLKGFGPPLVAIYIISDAGSVVGGWLSSRMMRAGMSANRARKLTMALCATCVVPIIGVQYVDTLWMAVLILGLATAAHQAFSANLLTIPSDLFAPHAVGSVVGLGGAAGAIGGMCIAKLVGYILDATGSYATIFLLAGSAYFLALAALHLCSPRLIPTGTGATPST